MSRKYQLLWEEIKLKGRVEITVERKIHDRVLAALKKESGLDFGFRFRCVEEGRSYTLENSQLGDLLQVHLEFRNTMPDSFVIGPESAVKRVKSVSKYEQRSLSPEEQEQMRKLKENL